MNILSLDPPSGDPRAVITGSFEDRKPLFLRADPIQAQISFGKRENCAPCELSFLHASGATTMGNFCWMCQRMRPNEAFSGRNHGRHLCRECARLPKTERERVRRLDSLREMLTRQSNISKKNLHMAAIWASEYDAEVAALAHLVTDIGIAHPHKKKRMPFIRRNRPELFKRMVAAGLAEEWPDDDRWNGYPTDEVPKGLDHRPEEPLDESATGIADYDDDEIPF